MRIRARSALALMLGALPVAVGPLMAQEGAAPLSAIDWLNLSQDGPVSRPGAQSEPPVASEISTPQIVVTPLGEATRGAVGLLSSAVTGLPADIWQASTQDDLARLWRRAPAQPAGAIQGLYHTLLLAEAEPPRGDPDADLRTRVETLRRFGAVEPALQLLTRAGPQTAALFPDWFDLALLHGDQMEACEALQDAPELLESGSAHIYCTALTGDWRTAALLLDTGAALGELDGADEALLSRFLDAELAEEAAPLPPPSAPTPLEFRLFEAAGTPLRTRGLPLAFATADLSGANGWKAEIVAAERLARAGALAPGRLLGLYTRQRPAASGGVWDRARAVQRLEKALESAGAGEALETAWNEMREEGLELPFAQMIAARLADADLPQRQRRLAFRLALLTADYEAAADRAPDTPEAQLLAGIATGKPDLALATGPAETMIAAAFDGPSDAARNHARLIEQGKLGEAILSAALQFDRADGDPGEMADALGTLRAVGLEDTARRAALEALILGIAP